MITKYFEEINEGNMDFDFLMKLDQARELAGIPFIITSAYRNQLENARVGGKPNSSHLKGLAVDISVKDSRTRFIVLEALIKVGFHRIGIGKTFIHVDDDEEKDVNVTWLYD